MKTLSESDLKALERKLARSKKESRKKVTIDMEDAEALIALSKAAVKDGKGPDRILFNITVEDNTDHVQVYKHDKNSTVKLGNIRRDDSGNYEAEDHVYGKQKWKNFTRALAYLISPRGMS